jgi:hypothetical protein
MICPKCGAEIPDDYMYCGKCGHEIHIVPEFEPEVENKINETLFGIANEFFKGEEFENKHGKKPKTGLFNHNSSNVYGLVLALVLTVALIIALIVVFVRGGFDTDSDTYADSTISVEYVEEDEPETLGIETPVFSLDSGVYEEAVEIAITSNSGLDIYYTVNGEDADSQSILYEAPIVLEEDGEYEISAIAIDDSGNKSEVASAVYTIEIAGPSAPDVVEQSGDYTQSTMIVVVPEEGCTIYYTTDGTDPTPSSNIYTSPIAMPIGTSHFAFIAVDQENNYSEITYRDYHLIYTRLISTEQAVNSVIDTLVRLKYLINAEGKAIGYNGNHYYEYQEVIEINGSGEYYVIVENHRNNDGSTYATGLLYAVNTHDGTVCRLGYDSSGKYTLITLSNR